MQPLSFESITVDEIDLPIITEKNIRLAVLRLDKIHPIISGNKWFKLKYYVQAAKNAGKEQLLTFGGPYSNHIIATAATGNLFGFKTTGIIRGERPKNLSYTLSQAAGCGMELIFTTRKDYRDKKLSSDLVSRIDNIFIIGEGGYGLPGTIGAAEILDYCKKDDYSHIACAVGTATMMAGLIKAAPIQQQVVGISVLKNNKNLDENLFNLLSPKEREKMFQIVHEYHFGGYAKHTKELVDFMNQLFMDTETPTDFVYTGKLFCALFKMIRNNFFSEGSSILAIHSGGLQGNLSLPQGTLIF